MRLPLGIQNAFLFISADDEGRKTDSQFEMQQMLMAEFFLEVSADFIVEFSQGKPLHAMCEWSEDTEENRVTCVDGILRTVFFAGLNAGNFRIGYLPNTVEHVFICECNQKYTIQTRLLPLCVYNVMLHNNDIYGTIDLHHLPPRLRLLDIGENKISGPIELSELPPDLESLRLFGNRIKQDVVYYKSIPKRVRSISLGGNTIRKVAPVSGELSIENKRCIMGVPRKCIF